jgi:hypothetical protein
MQIPNIEDALFNIYAKKWNTFLASSSQIISRIAEVGINESLRELDG